MKKQHNKIITEDIQYRPIVIPKATVDLLLKEKEPLSLIGLYNFYYYTAIWQNTNRPKATVKYISKGSKVSPQRIRRWRRRLIELNLIKDVQLTKNGNFSTRLVQVNYIPVLMDSRSTRNHKEKCVVTNNINMDTTKVGVREIKKPTFFGDIKTFDKKYTKRLKEIIDKKGVISHQTRISSWEREIRDLRIKGIKNKPITKKRIKSVINWYQNHIKDKYTPQLFKVSDFKSKFLRIEDAMNRDKPKTDVKISREAKKIVGQLCCRNWPMGTKVELPVTVQISLDNYKAFIQKHEGIQITTKPHTIAPINNLMYYLTHKLSPPPAFVRNWMLKVHDQIANWKNWNGNLIDMAFDIDSKKFRQIGRQWADDYCKDPARWDKYMELINEDRK